MATKKNAITETESKNTLEPTITKVRLHVVFTDPLLGTASANAELHTEYIASKAPDAMSLAEEVAAIGADEVEERGMTVFPRNANGEPIMWDYQLKGFFKESCQMLKRAGAPYLSSKLTMFKKKIDGLVFPRPRQIVLHLPEGAEMGECQRPLRAQTAQGERVALAHSEELPEGSWFECEVALMDKGLVKPLLEWMDYAEYHGMGQWRNSGKGRAVYTAYDMDGKVLRSTE